MKHRILSFENLDNREMLSVNPIQPNNQAAAVPAVAIMEPVGYFVLTPAQNTGKIRQDILDDKDITGVVLRNTWANIQPKKGVYDWSYFDKEIAHAQQYGKLVKLTVLTGIQTPMWATTRWVTFKNENVQPSHPNSTYKIPVPWATDYLTNFTTFVKAFGARYNNNRAIVEINMGGVTQFSNEMFLPDEVTKLKDYSADKIVAAWAKVSDAYSAAFPNKAVCLNMANVFNPKDGIVEKVVNDFVTKLGSRATLQHDSLSAKTSSGYNIQQILEAQHKKGVRVGYEMVSKSEEARFGGTFDQAINFGRNAGAQYFDIYYPDIPRVKLKLK